MPQLARYVLLHLILATLYVGLCPCFLTQAALAEDGSVVIHVKPAYLETLADGKHTLTTQFDDGDDATASFTIKPQDIGEDEPDDEGDEEGDDKLGDEGDDDKPGTRRRTSAATRVRTMLEMRVRAKRWRRRAIPSIGYRESR